MKVLSDRYELTRRIAVGGMGEVWAATDNVLHREVAVKILRDDLADSDVFLERFRAEARHTAALSHPGIARVFDYGEDHQEGKRLAFLVMELVHGQPLSKVMDERGALPLNTVLSYLAQTAEALHAAHALGVVHRDVKPGNLLVLDDGGIKVTDFGIARATNSVSITEVGQVLGTAKYMSPEQASGAEATPASDVYALGVIGYEMLAGHPLFTAQNAGALAMAHVHQAPPLLPSSVPAAVRGLIAEALSKQPADRPRDAKEFAGRLRRLQLANMPPPVGTHPIEPAGPTEPTGEAGEQTIAMPIAHQFDAALARTRRTDALGDGSRTEMMPAADVAIASDPLIGTRRQLSPRRRRRWVIGTVLAALIAMVVVAQLGHSTDRLGVAGSSPGGTTLAGAGADATSTTTVTTRIALPGATIDAAALIGKTLVQVSTILAKAGYLVASKSVADPSVASGLVVAVQPSGVVPYGTRVTLSVSAGPILETPPPTTTKRHGKTKG